MLDDGPTEKDGAVVVVGVTDWGAGAEPHRARPGRASQCRAVVNEDDGSSLPVLEVHPHEPSAIVICHTGQERAVAPVSRLRHPRFGSQEVAQPLFYVRLRRSRWWRWRRRRRQVWRWVWGEAGTISCAGKLGTAVNGPSGDAEHEHLASARVRKLEGAAGCAVLSACKLQLPTANILTALDGARIKSNGDGGSWLPTAERGTHQEGAARRVGRVVAHVDVANDGAHGRMPAETFIRGAKHAT